MITFTRTNGRTHAMIHYENGFITRENKNYSYTETTEFWTGNEIDLGIQFISHPEGYIEPSGASGFDHVYQYKDHLGNIRLSYKDSNNDGSVDSSEIIEENNYYPFGLKHKGYNNVVNGQHYPYGYNGKEENDELGLEWLDFGARNHDASLGRWMNIDPLAEEMRRHSPYNYAFDNPVYFIDPDGRKPEASQTADVYYDWDEGGYRTQEGDDEGDDDCCPDGDEPSEVSSLKNYLSNNSVLNALNSLFGGDGESSSDWSFLEMVGLGGAEVYGDSSENIGRKGDANMDPIDSSELPVPLIRARATKTRMGPLIAGFSNGVTMIGNSKKVYDEVKSMGESKTFKDYVPTGEVRYLTNNNPNSSGAYEIGARPVQVSYNNSKDSLSKRKANDSKFDLLRREAFRKLDSISK